MEASMKAMNVLLAAALGAGLALAQTPAAVSAGTHVDARLQTRLNAQAARVGDPVTAVTTAAVKDHGRIVLPKGTRLRGHVTSVLAAQDAQSPSRIGILFDQASTASGGSVPVHFAIAGVTRAAAQAEAIPEPAMMPPAPMPMPAAGAAGGLGLGGAVLAPVGAAGDGLGSAAAVVAPMPALGAPQPVMVGAGASAGADSVLSVPRGNLMLASGTRLQLVATGGGH
jgi:hypothetical protein